MSDQSTKTTADTAGADSTGALESAQLPAVAGGGARAFLDPQVLAGLPDKAAMVQLYRGELGRLTTYRVRLDTTTNWALGTSVALVSFSLGQHEVPHAVLLLPYLLSVVFLYVESRRYQEFAMSHHRVRLLETGFFAAHLGGEAATGWKEALIGSLHQPQTPVSFLGALALRTRRNYLWMFLTIYGSWLLKLWLTHTPLPRAAAIATLPGEAVLAAASALTLLWVACAILPIRAAPERL